MKYVLKNIKIFLLLMVFILMPHSVLASNDFYISPILPENQRNFSLGYYDLKVDPGSEQDIYLEIHNTSDKEQRYFVSVNPGTTNRNGIIDYSPKPSDYKFDSSLTLPITDFVTVSKRVTVPANSSEKVPIKIKMPETPFEGIVIGAIYITSEGSEDLDEEMHVKKTQAQVVNKISYSIGIVLREMDTEPQVDLNIQDFNYDVHSMVPMFQAELQNPVSMVLNDITYDAVVKKTGTDDVIAEQKVSGFRFAPQSNFWLDIPVNKDITSLDPGNYSLYLSVYSKETDQSWTFETTYNLKNSESNQFKKILEINNVPEASPKFKLLWLIIVVIMIFIVGVFIFIYRSKTKK